MKGMQVNPSPKPLRSDIKMTVLFVFVALMIANFLFTRWDDKRMEEARRLNDFYRIEYKKCYDATMDTNWMTNN